MLKLHNDPAWSELGKALKDVAYHFTTITPVSHHRFLENQSASLVGVTGNGGAKTSMLWLRDLLGWNRRITLSECEKCASQKGFDRVWRLLQQLNLLKVAPGFEPTVVSQVRFSTLDLDSSNPLDATLLFLHSAFPTVEEDSVFFGPDSYRFIHFLQKVVRPASVVADLGCGSGVGGIFLSKSQVGANLKKVFLTDINQKALKFSNINIELNGVSQADTVESNLFEKLPLDVDLIVSNPPFIVDPIKRAYRHGGAYFGIDLSVRIVEEGLARLKKGGQLAIYTGACIFHGEDVFWKKINPLLSNQGLEVTYSELDPDIFNEELNSENYRGVERIAAVGLYIQKH